MLRYETIRSCLDDDGTTSYFYERSYHKLMKGVAIYKRDEGRSPQLPVSQPIGVYQDQFDFQTLREAILAISCLASLVSATAFYVTYKYRNERVFRAASRTFMYLY
jgi:hypothetical protein